MGRSQGSWGAQNPYTASRSSPSTSVWPTKSSSNGGGTWDWDKAGSESAGKLHEEAAHTPRAPTLATWLVLSQPTNFRPHEEFLYVQLNEEEENVWFTAGEALHLLSGTSPKESREGKSSQWAERWALHLVGCSFCLENEMGPQVLRHRISRQPLGSSPQISACAHQICELISKGKS